MYLTVKQQLKHLSKSDYRTLKELCHIAKNLTNQAIYNARQYYLTDREYLNYPKNYALLKDSENYKLLNSNMAQQILKEVDGSFQSFFGLLKLAKKGRYDQKDIKLPHYLPKDGYQTLIIGFIRLKEGHFILPMSNQYRKEHKPVTIKLPPILKDKDIREIHILPKADARFFEVQYIYEVSCIQRNLNTNHALALDLGVDNLITAVSDTGESFIIDGKRLKSVNQWYNKENARLQAIKDHQDYGKRRTKRQQALLRKRNACVNDYLSKAAKQVINHCINHDIGILVVGYNETFQRFSNLGKRNNQNFLSIPYGKLREKLEYLCGLNGITFIKQEESYTSKASFWDQDKIPVFTGFGKGSYQFSGKRVHRGLYQCKDGSVLNADVNGALNILRKSNVVSLTALYDRGEVDTPVRIRVA